ncbi:MAG: pentapeptide repeat-containing protein [Cyanobacteriota bacterium]
MANEEHLEILMQGVEVWNEWRKNNPGLIPQLNESSLWSYEHLWNPQVFSRPSVNLSRVNFSRANLYRLRFQPFLGGGRNTIRVDLSEADLSEADLIEANLTEADLQGANLSGANLSRANLSGANLSGAIITGACIDSWIIKETNLEGIKCEHIYLDIKTHTYRSAPPRNALFTQRRPYSRNFKPGEFTKLFQKALETVDIVFLDSIDWKAFLVSFLELKSEYGNDEISIQAFENRNGAFIVRINVPPNVEKAEIERFVEDKYKMALDAKDKHIVSLEGQISVKNSENRELLKIVCKMSESPKIENNFYSYTIEQEQEDCQYVIEQEWKRFSVLKAIYMDSGGKSNLATTAFNICKTTGISGEECVHILEYLEREELIKALTSLYGDISTIATQITHKGIREVEAAIKKPNESTEHFSYQIFNNTFVAPVASFQQTGEGNSSTIHQNFGSNKPFPNNQTSQE